VHTPELVHEVLVVQADKFHKSRGMKAIFKDALGNGLLTSDGEFWKRQRRLAQPAFHMRRIAAYADVMVAHAERLLEEWRARTSAAPGESIDIAEEMMRLTLGIVAKVLFDADVSSQAQRVGKAITTGQEITNRRFNSLIRLPRWVPTPDNRRGTAALQVIDDVVMGIIEERRVSGKDHGDLLSMLLMAVDEDGTGA
jgi:cytochrome P450